MSASTNQAVRYWSYSRGFFSQTFSFLSQWKWTCFYLCGSITIEIRAWQHPSAGPLIWERHPTAQLCPVHSCRGSAAPQMQGRLFPHPIASKNDYLSPLQSPAGSSFCLDAWLAVPALDVTPAPSDPLHHLLHVSSCSGDEHLLTL